MELRSPTGTKNSKLIKWPEWLFWPLLLLCLLPTVFFMSLDSYRTGDEVITYGMANEPAQGWMFSKGRIRSYLDHEILQDGIGGVFKNLAAAGKDILQNRRNAVFFQTERPAETGWYSGEQLRGFLAIEKGEAFHPGQVYLNAMGDDANSFLYYLCLHLLSSLIPGISAGKWSGFLLNLLCMGVLLYLLYRICCYYMENRGWRFFTLLSYACSAGAIEMYTNARPYSLAAVFFAGLFLQHLRMFEILKRSGAAAAKKYMKRLIPVYMLGYVSHYTMGIWAVCLGVFTLCTAFLLSSESRLGMTEMHNCQNPKEFIKGYLATGLLAVLLGICVDPMSVFGLLSKLKGTESASLRSAYGGVFGKAVYAMVSGNDIWLLLLAGLLVLAVARYLQKEKKADWRIVLFCLLPFGYVLLSTFLMRTDKISTVIPYFFIMLGLLIGYVSGEQRRWKAVLASVLFLLWCIGGFHGMADSKKQERGELLLFEEQMAQHPSDTMVFVRAHGSGYDKIPLLGRYREVYVLTTDDGWQEHRGELMRAVADSGMFLCDGDSEACDMILEWLSAGGLEKRHVETLYGNDQAVLIRVRE
ncbi:MAG: hypothetical protein IJ600_10830 [Lachnospiraceae bacterium]|nr:hypothetical protein [Lachnospiraceae bacterium]